MAFGKRYLAASLTLCLFVLSLGVFSRAAAQDGGVTDDDVNRVAQQLFCPTCESVPVDVCPTQVCSDWRAEIRSQLAAGRSEAEILDYFAQRYGESVLANPPAQGFGLFLWIAPIVVVIVGTFIFWRFMQSLQKAPAPPSPIAVADQPLENNIQMRLEEELKRKT